MTHWEKFTDGSISVSEKTVQVFGAYKINWDTKWCICIEIEAAIDSFRGVRGSQQVSEQAFRPMKAEMRVLVVPRWQSDSCNDQFQYVWHAGVIYINDQLLFLEL